MFPPMCAHVHSNGFHDVRPPFAAANASRPMTIDVVRVLLSHHIR